MSAIVGELPWQNLPVSFSPLRCASMAFSASSVQCASHLLRVGSSSFSSFSMYVRMRGTTSGCPSAAAISARPLTRARPRGSFGSKGGCGLVSSRYSMIAIDWKSGGAPSSRGRGGAPRRRGAGVGGDERRHHGLRVDRLVVRVVLLALQEVDGHFVHRHALQSERDLD